VTVEDSFLSPVLWSSSTMPHSVYTRRKIIAMRPMVAAGAKSGARWILTRLEALTTADVLSNARLFREQSTGSKRAREITSHLVYRARTNRSVNDARPKMAKDMARPVSAAEWRFNRGGIA